MTTDPLLILLVSTALLLLAAVSHRHHAYAVVLITALLPTYLLRLNIAGLPTTFLELAIVSVFLAGVLAPSVRSSWYTCCRSIPSPILLLLALFLIASIISIQVSPHLQTSLGVLKGWLLFPLLLGWLVYCLARKPRNITSILLALSVSGTVLALLSFAQLGQLSRVKSIFDTPNSLALFLAPILVATLWQSRAQTRISGIQHRFLLYCAAIMALALLATQSVAAIVTVLLSLLAGIITWIKAPARKRYFTSIALSLLLALLVLTLSGRLAYLTRPLFNPRATNSISVRLQLWSIAWELIKERPLLGSGLGTFEPAYQDKLHERFRAYEQLQPITYPDKSLSSLEEKNPPGRPLPEYVFRDPHNWLLSFWINTGLLGLVSFIGLHIYIVYHLIIAQPRKKLPIQIQAVILSLLTIFLFGLTDTIFWKNDLASLHFILLALLASTLPARINSAAANALKSQSD